MSLTLTQEQSAALARVGGTLAGGRHAFRITDESVKAEAQGLANESRKAKRAEAARAKRRFASDDRERMFADYDDETLARIVELRSVWASMPKRSAIRSIARAVLHNRATCRECMPLASDETCERGIIPADWRDTVRAYAAGSARASVLGAFPIKRDDMRIDTSVLMLSVRKHWHEYAGGKHVSVHGADAEDAFQSGMLAAIESGDYVTDRKRKNGTLDTSKVPTYGRAFWHVRASVNALATGRGLASMRTFGTGNDEIEPFNFDTFEPRTIEDWLAYESHRDILDSRKRVADRIAAERAERMVILSEARQSLAILVNSGMSVRAIAGALGRTPNGILSDLADDMPPAEHALPVVVTDDERETARARVLAQAEHALKLRAIAAIRDADTFQTNYALGAIRANGESVGTVPDWFATDAAFRVNADAASPLALSPMPRIAWENGHAVNVA